MADPAFETRGSTSQAAKNQPAVTRHVLSSADAKGLDAYFNRRRQFAAAFTGSPRESYDLMTAETPIAGGIRCEQVAHGAVQGWWVRPANAPADRAILFLHGGGYMFGTATAYRGFASQLAVRANIAVFAADYPLAPEHPFPAAHETILAVRRWLKGQNIGQIALVGDSAGGGLAFATLLAHFPESPDITSIVVYSPWLDLALTGDSFSNPAIHDPIFKPAMFTGLVENYLGTADAKDPRASPLYGIPDHLPPIAIQVGADEILLDDSIRYAARAAAKGGVVELDIFAGLHHVFQRCVTDLASARLAFDKTAAFITKYWRGTVP